MATYNNNKNEKRCSEILGKLSLDREKGETCDITLLVETEHFNAHKSVLVANSDYFRVMFTGSFEEKGKKLVELRNVPKNEFKLLLDYMYGEILFIEEKSLEDLTAALSVAKMLCLDTFINECEDYVSQWRTVGLKNGKVSLCYDLAKQLNMLEIEESIKKLVFENILIDQFKKDRTKINFQDVSLDLFNAALQILENQSKLNLLGLISYKEANGRPSLIGRLTKILEWLVQHSDEDEINMKTMIDKYAQLENIQQSDFNSVTKLVFNGLERDKCNVLLLLVTEMFSKIQKNIAKTIRHITVFEHPNHNLQTFKLADYDPMDNIWHEMSINTQPLIFEHSFVANHQLYLVANDQYAIFDFERKSLSETKQLHLQNQVKCLCIFVLNNDLYILGKRDTGQLVIIIEDILKNCCKEHEIDQFFSNCCSITVKNGSIFFQNDKSIFSYDTDLLKLKLIITQSESNVKKILVADAKNLFIFRESSSTYCCIPIQCNKPFEIDRSINEFNCQFHSAISTESGVIIATKNGHSVDEIQLFSTDSNKFSSTTHFVPLGFVPQQSLVIFNNVAKPRRRGYALSLL